MKILLVTTLPNDVHTTLSEICSITLRVVDCVDYANISQHINREIKSSKFDLLFTYRCPCIISTEIIDSVGGNAFNIHPSLLPKYAGLNPWREIMRSGDSSSGVTLHRLSSVIDGGEIIMTKPFNLYREETLKYNRTLADIAAGELLKEFLAYYYNILN